MKRERIPPGKDFLMKLVALGFDVVGAILNITGIGGSVVGLFGDLTFFLWYLIIGSPILSSKSIRRAGGMAIIELVPFLDILPGFSWFVWKQNKMVKEEDERYNKEEEEKFKSKRTKEQQLAIVQTNTKEETRKEIEQKSNFRVIDGGLRNQGQDIRAYATKTNQEEDDLKKAA